MDNDNSLITTIIGHKYFFKTIIFGFIVAFVYFFFNFIFEKEETHSNVNSNTNNINDATSSTVLNQQNLIRKSSSKKRICFVWKREMIIEDLVSLFTLLTSLNFEIYLLIKTESNDIEASKKLVNSFSSLFTKGLIKEHHVLCTFKEEGLIAIVRGINPYVYIDYHDSTIIGLVRFIQRIVILNLEKIAFPENYVTGKNSLTYCKNFTEIKEHFNKIKF